MKVKKYVPELIICLVLLAVLLAGSEGPDDLNKRQLLQEPVDQTVISPPPETIVRPAKTTDNTTIQGIVPIRIQIPSVKIDAQVVPVGVLKNGAMDVPRDDKQVGWLSVGFRPGEPGSAVMAGHVDNLRGVAVFYPLHHLKIFDEVIVSAADGTQMTFIVKEKRSYRTEQAPIRYIFGKSTVPRLNLITCTGYFDPRLRTHIDRLVVYTELKTKSG